MGRKKYIRNINILIFVVFSFFSLIITRSQDSDVEKKIETLTSIEYREDNSIYQYYYDLSGKITYNSEVGYASSIKEIDNKGNVIKESFFDQNNIQCKNNLGYFTVSREYDSCNRNIKETYFDMVGNLMLCNNGYASVKRVFNKTSIAEYYYDLVGNPTKASDGQYGILKYDFDKLDRYTDFLYLDDTGEPMNCSWGYAGAKITYNEDGTIKTVMYHDVAGNPVKLSDGQYGVRYSAKGDIYLNLDGSKQIRIIELISKRPECMIIVSVFLIYLFGILFRKGQQILLLSYCGVILFLTFGQRGVQVEGNVVLCFWDSYKQFLTSNSTRITVLENIWLFIPFGAGIYNIYSSKRMVVVGICFSILIEIFQLVTGRGIFETADIINNSIGTAIGIAVASSITWEKVLQHKVVL